MPTNKNAQIRYQALDRCFSNFHKRFFIEDLLEECNKALFEFNPLAEGIKKRQLQDDIRYMSSQSGYSIELGDHRQGKRKYYRYKDSNFSIRNNPLNDAEIVAFKEALNTLGRITGLPQFTWIEEIKTRLESTFDLENDKHVISFDQNPFLRGLNHMNSLYQYILNEQVVDIQYKSFQNTVSRNYTLSPYFLKQYNSRWYLIGKDTRFDTLTHLALDRIEEVKQSADCYIKTDVDFEEYFQDIIGISLIPDDELVELKLKVSPKQIPYLETKPLHGSQKPVKKTVNGDGIFEYELIPNYELYSRILGLGDSVEVIEPIVVREEIRNKITAMLANYSAE